jgi:transposase-like protein
MQKVSQQKQSVASNNVGLMSMMIGETRDLPKESYVYIWADGIYFNIMSDEYILITIGETSRGDKESLAIEDDYEESEQSWTEKIEALNTTQAGFGWWSFRFLEKDREELLAFYDYPADHWPHIKTTNSIESTFSTIRLRTKKIPTCVSRTNILPMVYKLELSAQKGWRKLRGFRRLADVINSVKFIDGIDEETFERPRNAA